MNPDYARPTEENPYYRWSAANLPRVTSITGQISDEYLRMWYGKMAARECADAVERYRSQDGSGDIEELLDFVSNVEARSTAAPRFRDFRGDIGTVVHLAVNRMILGDAVPEGIDECRQWLAGHAAASGVIDSNRDAVGQLSGAEPYADTLASAAFPLFTRVKEFIEYTKPEFEFVGLEAVVINEKEAYAGTSDGQCTFRKSDWRYPFQPWPFSKPVVRPMVDFKTSRRIHEFEYRMQTEAYRHAEFIGLMATGETHPLPETDSVAILHIEDTRVTVHAYAPSEAHFDAFLALRDVYGLRFENRAPKRERKQTVTEARSAWRS